MHISVKFLHGLTRQAPPVASGCHTPGPWRPAGTAAARVGRSYVLCWCCTIPLRRGGGKHNMQAYKNGHRHSYR
eukprot:48086-Eustigmatos_ZCMA.PRE.1